MELRYYQSASGRRPFVEGLAGLGGDKRTQDEDIKDAKRYFADFKRRSAQAPGSG